MKLIQILIHSHEILYLSYLGLGTILKYGTAFFKQVGGDATPYPTYCLSAPASDLFFC